MKAWAGILAALVCGGAHAEGLYIPEIDLRLEGLADLRLVQPSSQLSYLDGGLGKTRWGSDRHNAVLPELGGVWLRGVLGVTPEIIVVADIRADTQQQNGVDLIDAYIRWRPVSTSPWRWSVKAGAFFVPVSLENTGIGWISEWTLTPSAINSWIGDVVLLAQGMVGSTAIAPSPGFVSTTDFYAAYVLAGLERGDWRYALRLDRFGTDQIQPGQTRHEHGTAVTAAVTWQPLKWLRLTGEVLVVDYWRNQLLLEGNPPHAVETPTQMALRLSF